MMPAEIRIELRDEAATAALAVRLAAVARPGDVIALRGPLGAGKTAFARAFIHASGGTGEVPSPTFTLVQIYELPGGPVWHIDCYRLRQAEEAWELGIEDAFRDAITLIEWPERIAELLPARRLDVTLAPGGAPGSRRAHLSGGEAWAGRLAGVAADA
jgi:tRNA threonylcarbamoyladenosine biosynthesis protein TsaE